MARPTVMTPEVIAKLEEAFAWGCSDIEACLWADIAPKTLYVYQEKNPEFAQRKAALKETQGTYEIAKTYLDWTVIRSPINGVRESPLLATFLRLLAPYEYRVRMRWRS